MMRATLWLVFLLVPTLSPVGRATAQEVRQSARDLGIVVGVLPPGPLNAITDVARPLVYKLSASPDRPLMRSARQTGPRLKLPTPVGRRS